MPKPPFTAIFNGAHDWMLPGDRTARDNWYRDDGPCSVMCSPRIGAHFVWSTAPGKQLKHLYYHVNTDTWRITWRMDYNYA